MLLIQLIEFIYNIFCLFSGGTTQIACTNIAAHDGPLQRGAKADFDSSAVRDILHFDQSVRGWKWARTQNSEGAIGP